MLSFAIIFLIIAIAICFSKTLTFQYLTLGLPTFFYPDVYQGVENDTQGIYSRLKDKQCRIY